MSMCAMEGGRVATQPAMAVTSVTISAPAPRELAAFYARMLGWSVVQEYPARPGEPPEAGWAQVGRRRAASARG